MRAPILSFNDQRESIVAAVTERVVQQVKSPIYALNEAAFFEIRRLGPSGGPKYAEWYKLASSLGRMSEGEARGKLEELVKEYAWDVAGNFDPRVYKIASRALPPVLGALLSPRSILKTLPTGASALGLLDDRIAVQGPRAILNRLAEMGTLVFVPTHLSNLDSVVFGFALERAGLPPATYGAGKNLFTNPVLSFFMHNLGAYRVDRRLKHALYKDVLKAYSCVLIERGYHSLFFPGGTRSRSGGVERKLKLGLAGTALEAFGRTAEQGRAQRVFFVPATINYLLTLEAETLIDDYLQEEGKARYIIEDDESTRLARIAAFSQKLFGLEGAVVIRFSQPLDCFGNAVDEDGVSRDVHGRAVDATSYLVGKDGKPHCDPQRDVQYTRELGEAICRSYKRDTVVMPTHLAAAAAFDHLRRTLGKTDLFALLNHRGTIRVPASELGVEALFDKAAALASRGEIVLAPHLAASTALDSALRAFAGYHSTPPLVREGDSIVLKDTRLLYYYQNRLAAHGLAYAPK